MNNAIQILVEMLDAACRRVQESEFAFVAGISKQRTLDALRDLRRQFAETGSLDIMEARMLFAPSGGLQEVALQNGWGREYLELSRAIDQVVEEPKEHR